MPVIQARGISKILWRRARAARLRSNRGQGANRRVDRAEWVRQNHRR